MLSNFSAGDGWELSQRSFLRSEVGIATRFTDSEFEDTLARIEANYYNVIGERHLGRWSLGQHTLAGNFSIDYGEQLSKDRQFWVGGHHGLRGYSNRTFVGDKSIILNLEDRAHLFDDLWRLFSLGSVVFADVGGASYDNFGDLITKGIYSNVGVGLRFAFPRFTGSGIVSVDMAIPLRDGPDGTERFEPRFLVSGGQFFSSWLRSERIGAERATVGVGFDR